MIVPYSEKWLVEVLRACVKDRVKSGYPWFDAKAVAKRYAKEVEINAMLGREAVRHVLYGIIAISEIGPQNQAVLFAKGRAQ